MKVRTILSQGFLASRASYRSTTYVGGYGVQWRRYSTPATAPGVLPLEGIRVLDMTRVLAGVSAQLICETLGHLTDSFYSLIVHKYWEIWGMHLIEQSFHLFTERQPIVQM